MATAGTRLLLPLAALLLRAGAPGLPFDRVAPGTTHVVFYRAEGGYQFLFVYRMPERKLVALELDRREAEEALDADGDGESGEVIHHLPLSRLEGRIQFLAADGLPEPRGQLLRLRGKRRAVVDGVALEASGSGPESWLGLAPALRRP